MEVEGGWCVESVLVEEGRGVSSVLVEEGSSGLLIVPSERNGELLVGPGFTYSVMSCGMVEGVTLSMNCHDGRSSTLEPWSE